MKKHSEECNKEMRNCNALLIEIKTGAFLFTGMNNKPETIGLDIYEKQLGQSDTSTKIGSKKRDITGVRATFASPLLGDTNISYGNKGIVLISLVMKNFVISAWSDELCVPFFDTKEDYASEEFSCFCQEGTRGYATITAGCIGRCFDDIAICNIHEVAIPYGYISYKDYGVIKENDYSPYIISKYIKYISVPKPILAYCYIEDYPESCYEAMTNVFYENYTEQMELINEFRTYQI